MTRKRAQRGQATTEVIVMSAVLVPMFLLVPALGKIADMNHAAIEAARYASWERTVAPEAAKSDAQLGEEVRRRFFSNVSAFIITNEGTQAADNQRNQLWRDHADGWVLRNYGDVTLGVTNSGTPGNGAGLVSNLMGGFMSAMGRFNGNGDVGLNTNGLYRADVNVNVGSIPMAPLNAGVNCAGAQSNDFSLCIRRHHVILADTWASGNSTQMQQRVQGLVPTSAFQRFSAITDLVANIPVLEEFGRFSPGYVAQDTVIPPDRQAP